MDMSRDPVMIVVGELYVFCYTQIKLLIVLLKRKMTPVLLISAIFESSLQSVVQSR